MTTQRVDIQPTELTLGVANRIALFHLSQAQTLHSGVLQDVGIECLHHYRVHLRKARAAISLFASAYSKPQAAELKSSLAQLMKPSGKVRDLDVYLASKHNYYQLLPNALHAGLDLLFEKLSQERAIAFSKLAAHLDSKAYQQAFADLLTRFDSGQLTPGQQAAKTIGTISQKLMNKRYQKLSLAAAQITASTPDSDIHQIRIQCKKFRYLLEFIKALLEPDKVEQWLSQSKQMQKELGEYNDDCVQQVFLQEFMHHHIQRHDANSSSFGSREKIALAAESVGALVVLLEQKRSKAKQNIVCTLHRFGGLVPSAPNRPPLL